MKLTAQEEYGLRCLLQIARKTTNGGSTISDISEEEGLSPPNTAKILRILRMNGFVASMRGVQGGYTLSRPPADILLGDVLHSLGGKLYEGDFCQNYAGHEDTCVHVNGCTVQSFWGGIQGILDHILYQTSLQDLLTPQGMDWWRNLPSEIQNPNKTASTKAQAGTS